MSQFRSVPKAMFPMLQSISGGKTHAKYINRSGRVASHYRSRGSKAIGLVIPLTHSIHRRFTSAAEKLGTTKTTVARALIQAGLPKLEKLASSVEKPVKKLCPKCGCK